MTHMSHVLDRPGMGWLPDPPDFRDFTVEQKTVPGRLQQLGETEPVADMLKQAGVADVPKRLPAKADQRQYFSAIEDQAALGSCTAQAGVGLLEYFERRTHGRELDGSRLFLYKVTRNLLHLTGDTGAWLRSTMAAMTLFGVPPEEYWPYVIPDYDIEPPAFLYSFASNFQALSYYRLDPPNTSRAELLQRAKANIAAGLVPMFGFTVYSSYGQAASNGGKFPFPGNNERVEGGHAVIAAGYDDTIEIKNANPGGPTTKGAFLIRNSWGTDWGTAGYGYLPYAYISAGLAVDWWSLVKNEWVNTGAFGV